MVNPIMINAALEYGPKAFDLINSLRKGYIGKPEVADGKLNELQEIISKLEDQLKTERDRTLFLSQQRELKIVSMSGALVSVALASCLVGAVAGFLLARQIG